jgi:GxxExxY protein
LPYRGEVRSIPERQRIGPQGTQRTQRKEKEFREKGGGRPLTPDEDALSHQVIGAAIEVHRHLGPGLLESAYEECLAYEFAQCGLTFERQKPLPVQYKGVKLDCGFRLDFLVGKLVVVEVKAVEALAPVHSAQVLTYLRLTGCRLGLLLNFNEWRIGDGIKRLVLNLTDRK